MQRSHRRYGFRDRSRREKMAAAGREDNRGREAGNRWRRGREEKQQVKDASLLTFRKPSEKLSEPKHNNTNT